MRYAQLCVKLHGVKTELTHSPATAAQFIRNGGIVAFPTETVYGLGASIFDEKAIGKIFEAKQRPADNPVIAHVGSLEQINELASEVPETARRLIEAFFPGPLTVVLKRLSRVPLIATAGLETVGVRMPGNSLANEFLRACGTPVAAPSANISGRPSPTTWQAVYDDMNGRIDCILQGEPTDIGLESTVVDCTADPPLVLRAGAVSLETLRSIVPEIDVCGSDDDAARRSPGVRHKHYAPEARVVIIDDDFDLPVTGGSAFIGLKRPDWSPTIMIVCGSVEEYARQVFAFFRECDKKHIETIYCQKVEEKGIGAALMDRLRRAESR